VSSILTGQSKSPVGKPYLDEEVAGHRMHPVHHRRCPVAHPHHRVPGHGPGHDESAEADPDLGVRSQTLPELSMHQLGSGRVAVVGRHPQWTRRETHLALRGAQDGQQTLALRRWERVQQSDDPDRSLNDVLVHRLVEDSAAVAHLHPGGEEHGQGEPGEQHQGESAEERPRD